MMTGMYCYLIFLSFFFYYFLDLDRYNLSTITHTYLGPLLSIQVPPRLLELLLQLWWLLALSSHGLQTPSTQ